LHLGHLVNAIYTWGVARALGGQVVLRLEDHDRSRCRPEFEVSILDDLAWLGLEADIGSPADVRAGASPYKQSTSEPAYRAALDLVRRSAHVFACDCTRRDIALAVPTPANEEPPYPGRCTRRGLPATEGRALRVVLPPGAVEFDDVVCGPQVQTPSAQVGALLLRDRFSQWTYQFAVAVDDVRHGIGLVVRGADLLPSTGRQIQVMRMLGREAPPVYLHHPLVQRPDGLKLSKANRDAGVRDLRAAGLTAPQVFGLAALAAGLLEAPRPVSVEEFPHLLAP
jgi:glutamyl-tRNA synthetase/glutamyl-Q tRNA(Asp) synthetase